MLDKKIGQILIEEKAVSKAKVEEALTRQISHVNGRRLGDILISDMNAVSEDALYRALAIQYELPFFDLEKTPIPVQSINSLSYEVLSKYNFIPYHSPENKVYQIIHDPTNLENLDELGLYLKTPLHLLIAGKTAVNKVLDKISSLKKDVERISEDFSSKVEANDEGLNMFLGKDEGQPLVKLVNSIIYNAIRKKASDIHIEISDSEVSVKYRIDGILQRVMDNIDKKYAAGLISRIKVMAELNLAEKRIPQDGRFKIKFQDRSIDFRISILPTMYGEVCVIRLLDKSSMDLKLDGLGFEGIMLEKFNKLVKQPYGMILVTGPTGSGKTTSLYAALNHINSEEEKIITIEDPIEYLLFNTTQIPVNEKKGLTFARGLRSILRHDPDKIMVGEIRDSETAQIAVQSALTGHLVFTTIHANNVVDVIGRLINMGVKPYEFITALNCILAQRLIRKICPLCKKEVKQDKDFLEASGLGFEFKNRPFFEGAGCENCSNTGYSGRTGIFELMELTDKIKEMILKEESFIQIKALARKEGMITLREAGLKKVMDGITTLKEINRVTLLEKGDIEL